MSHETREALEQEWMDQIDAAITDMAHDMASAAGSDILFETLQADIDDQGTLRRAMQDWIMEHEGERINELLYQGGYTSHPRLEAFLADHQPAPTSADEDAVPNMFNNRYNGQS